LIDPFDIGDQAHRIGEIIIVEGDEGAARADIDLGDVGTDCPILDALNCA